MNHFSNKLIVKDPFEMPAVDDTTVLVLRECVDLIPHCWIWNESVGYLEVVTYSGYDIYVTVKNVGMKENATSGTIFPSCMEFLITAPNATPIIDNTVTCLRADFKCPTVGQEALMSVDSTSAIRVGDIIIVDTRYQYLVTEIINEHTMKVLNEEKGKEGGVIDVKCNECVPVKIFESTHCCEALQEQVDDIYNRIDTKKSVVSNNVLLSVAHGIDAISDVSYDIELDIDTDLSKYDNTTSAFITLGDIPALPSDTDLSHYDNSTSGFITSASLPTVNDAQLTIYESDGVTPFVSFSANAASNVTATLPTSGTNLIYFKELYDIALTTARFVPNTSSVATSYSLGNSNNWINESYIENTRVKTLIGQNYTDGITYPSSNSIGHTVIYDAGTTSLTNGRHEFRSGGDTILTINENGEIVVSGNIVPEVNNSSLIGVAGNSFAEGNINDFYSTSTHTTNLDINNVTHSEVASISTYTAAFDFSSIVGVANLHGSTYTIKTNDVVIANSCPHIIKCLVDVSALISRLRVTQTGNAQPDVSLLGQLIVTNMNTSTTSTIDICVWYSGQVLDSSVAGNSWREVCPVIVYTGVINLDANTVYTISASGILTFPGGNSNTVCRLPGGVTQRGNMRLALIAQ